MGCTVGRSFDEEIILLLKRIDAKVVLIGDARRRMAHNEADFLTLLKRSEENISDFLREIIEIAKHCKVLDGKTLNSLLISMNTLRRDEPATATKLSWLISTARKLVEERVPGTKDDIGDDTPALSVVQRSSIERTKTKDYPNSKDLRDFMLLENESTKLTGRSDGQPQPSQQSAAPKLNALIVDDGSRHSFEFGFFDNSQHSSAGGFAVSRGIFLDPLTAAVMGAGGMKYSASRLALSQALPTSMKYSETRPPRITVTTTVTATAPVTAPATAATSPAVVSLSAKQEDAPVAPHSGLGVADRRTSNQNPISALALDPTRSRSHHGDVGDDLSSRHHGNQ
jgi:hypothetical protein